MVIQTPEKIHSEIEILKLIVFSLTYGSKSSMNYKLLIS